ncbi:hypothetical protein N665_1395s0002 [Sinapis alba]|nr:hypothetical protein N665_1395s0002 [Sinapis alba]
MDTERQQQLQCNGRWKFMQYCRGEPQVGCREEQAE